MVEKCNFLFYKLPIIMVENIVIFPSLSFPWERERERERPANMV